MTPLRNLPFRHKLTLIFTLTSGLALLLACAAFLAYDIVSFRARMVGDLETLAQVVGDNSTAALTFNDPEAAEEVLGALRAKRDITAAFLFMPDGRIFASYRRPGTPGPAPVRTIETGGYRFEGEHLEVFRTIQLGDQAAGVVCIRSDLSEMNERLEHYGAAVGVVLIVCALAALVISSRLQGIVSRPIVDLATIARVVSVHRDYSVRAVESGNDEVAALTQAFNGMLSQIQMRDSALQAAHDELERRVEERTAELVREIAERQQAQEALRQSEEQLRHSQKMEAVGRLAGGIAHDFNNLLTAVTGYSQLLLMRLPVDDSLRSCAQQIRKASDRATALTRQLLAFSRKQLLEPKVVDLGVLVANMDAMLRRVIGEDIHLVSASEPGLGHVKADPGQIEQVLLNLVVNARDAMPKGGTLTLRSANLTIPNERARPEFPDSPGDYVLLEVSDTGCGMAPDVKSHIFEPFFTTKAKGKGTGLGLSMVYGIVKQSGGHIWVRSESGRGATFTILLPRVEGAAEEIPQQQAAAAPARGSETILLVEDEEVVRGLARDILEMNGYTVLEAAHGHDAIAVSKRHRGPIHLMLTDVVMPHMNGREVFERLVPFRPDLKVLYMSGYAESGIVHDGAIDPGTAFIPKPFTPEALSAKVREVLEMKEVGR